MWKNHENNRLEINFYVQKSEKQIKLILKQIQKWNSTEIWPRNSWLEKFQINGIIKFFQVQFPEYLHSEVPKMD